MVLFDPSSRSFSEPSSNPKSLKPFKSYGRNTQDLVELGALAAEFTDQTTRVHDVVLMDFENLNEKNIMKKKAFPDTFFFGRLERSRKLRRA